MKQYALVTGSTSGIGKEIGRMLIDKGFYVFFNYSSNEENVLKLNSEMVDYTGKYTIIKSDLSQLHGVEQLFGEIVKKTDKLDCIVLNAGATCRKSYKDIKIEDWNKVMNVNVTIPFFIMQRLDDLLSNDSKVISIASIMGIHPHSVSIPYSVSKAANIMLIKSLAKLYKDRRISVNAIAPGFVNTQWQERKEGSHKKRIEDKILKGRFANVKEIAHACMFLVENSYINGTVVEVDGGYNLE